MDNKKNDQVQCHFISNTHWDREWRFSARRTQYMLGYMLDMLIDIIEKNPEYKHFHLDSQTMPDQDYLEVYPEKKELFKKYAEIGEEGLWKNLEKFLKKVIPVAEECGVKMAIHPDDPPYPIFGLPRIITNEENLDRFLALVDSPANCLCLCTGSLGCAESNDIPAMVKKYAEKDRIAFMHIRNVKIMEDGSFEERAHLSSCGSLDMYEVVKALTEAGFDGYVRPDHGRMIWGETGKPGYGLFDRALGATYINGLFEACEKNLK